MFDMYIFETSEHNANNATDATNMDLNTASMIQKNRLIIINVYIS